MTTPIRERIDFAVGVVRRFWEALGKSGTETCPGCGSDQGYMHRSDCPIAAAHFVAESARIVCDAAKHAAPRPCPNCGAVVRVPLSNRAGFECVGCGREISYGEWSREQPNRGEAQAWRGATVAEQETAVISHLQERLAIEEGIAKRAAKGSAREAARERAAVVRGAIVVLRSRP